MVCGFIKNDEGQRGQHIVLQAMINVFDGNTVENIGMRDTVAVPLTGQQFENHQ